MTQYENWPEKYDIEKLVSIPEDIEKLKNGNKTSVRRNDRYADKGETIELDGTTFEVSNVFPQKLGDMTDEDAKDEGYDSLEAYKEAINNIHNMKLWNPDKSVWAHELKRV